MLRKIITIDEEKCIGCTLCATACQEGAIGMVNGKAKLLRDDYCDGLGNCLPVCPTGAITFEERDAAAFDKMAVEKNRQQSEQHSGEAMQGGCPGSKAVHLANTASAMGNTPQQALQSRLGQWPVQIKLVSVNAPYFEGAKLLIAADCSAFAYANLHEEFMKGHVTLIGCPKLDNVEYSEKLTEIIRQNNIKSVTIVRMEVPCCGGLEQSTKQALQNSGKMIPWQVAVVSIDGKLLD